MHTRKTAFLPAVVFAPRKIEAVVATNFTSVINELG